MVTGLAGGIARGRCAANVVPLRDPPEAQRTGTLSTPCLPYCPLMVTMVLLKDACMNATPCGNVCALSFETFFTFFPVSAASGAAAAAFAITYSSVSLIGLSGFTMPSAA